MVMQKQAVKIYGIIAAVLGVLGLFITGGHLFALMNADALLDWLRILLAAFLLYVGYRSTDEALIRTALRFVGVLYVVLAILGLFSSTLWGLLPNGFTGFDFIFHAVAGVIALVIASRDTDRAVIRD